MAESMSPVFTRNSQLSLLPQQLLQRLGITGHCDIMITTSVELLEELLREQGKL